MSLLDGMNLESLAAKSRGIQGEWEVYSPLACYDKLLEGGGDGHGPIVEARKPSI